VPDAERDEVLLAWEASRRSPLITAFAPLAPLADPARAEET
jgi:hypothetical protein